MKKVTVTLIMLMLVQVLAMAQYTGGNGRGDFMLGFSPCSNPASGGEIEAGQTICDGTTPAEITNKTTPAGYTGTLQYKWQSSTTSAIAGFDDIDPVSAGTGYSPGALTATT